MIGLAFTLILFLIQPLINNNSAVIPFVLALRTGLLHDMDNDHGHVYDVEDDDLNTELPIPVCPEEHANTESEHDGFSSDGFGDGEPINSGTSSWHFVPDERMAPLHASSASSINADTCALWQSTVFNATLSLQPTRTPLCFERGFAGKVLGHRNTMFPWLHRPSFVPMPIIQEQPTAVRTETVVQKPVTEVAWSVVKKRVATITWSESIEARRMYALCKWKHLLQVDPKHSVLGRLLLDEIWRLSDDAQLSRSVQDVFAHKATNTMLKRAARLQHFVLWCVKRSLPVLPVSEANVYDYLYDQVRFAPTMPADFREALHFVHGTLGWDGALTAADSPRVKGFAERLKGTKRPFMQSDPLTVRQVQALECAAAYASCPLDRLFAYQALFCIAARARWMEAQNITSFDLDFDDEGGGFAQAATRCTKTANNAEKKAAFLPLTAPVLLTTPTPWMMKWVELRKELGLPEFAEHKPALPQVLVNGKLGSMPLDAGEASMWLRRILAIYDRPIVNQRVSSHSLKRTLLSWAAKFGIDRLDRSILGYHVVPGMSSMLHYSRDEQSVPLRKLCEMLLSVRLGEFRPDHTRSGYFAAKSQRLNLDVERSKKQHVLAEGTQEEAVSSSSSSESSEADDPNELSDNDALVVNDEPPNARAPAKDASDNFVLHKRWMTLHCLKAGDCTLTSCGRFVDASYVTLTGHPAFQYHKCMVCFGKS